ncbi:BppU family phage baseplate upper protein [Leuconostoc carnosum]|uniref:BppU family phage baseplate upper protein n=1 Tax=Leuconostoc carnosum TaxID=1252 RepID=UPI00123900D1|nr:BppU family phage baseplate upper protein [Leuconostoc carnosum]KAA8364802.1 DUF2479 domain-containing protein [Leuconostoc carnosum]
MSNQYLSFDVTKQSTPQQLITGRQGDSQLKFVTMLFWDGDKNVPYDLTGKQVVFEALKPDNTHIVDYEGITVLDAPAGLVRYSFNEQVFSVAGTMEQAFFKITHTDSNKNVIADSTLEVTINILENRVEFGINSKDYLSEYDDLTTRVKKKFDDYAATVQDGIDKAAQIHNEITAIQKQIDDNNIVTKKHFNDELQSRDSNINNNIIESKNKLNNLDYKMVSIALTRDTNIIVNDHVINHLKLTKTNVSFCPLVYVSDKNSSSLIVQDINRLQTFVDTISSTGVKVQMLKPHIATSSQGDAFDRATYNPSNYDAFFANWKSILLSYAAFAEKNNIDILCVGCEQYLTTNNQYLSKWQDICSSIKAKYPHLKLTYAMNTTEYLSPTTNWDMIACLDLAGLNVYPKYTSNPDYTKMPPTVLAHAWSGDNHFTRINYAEIIANIRLRYGKNVLITESGVLSVSDGLVWFLSNLKNPIYGNFEVTKLAIQTMRIITDNSPAIKGIAWWGFEGQFGVIPLDSSDSSMTVAETEISDWFSEVK